MSKYYFDYDKVKTQILKQIDLEDILSDLNIPKYGNRYSSIVDPHNGDGRHNTSVSIEFNSKKGYKTWIDGRGHVAGDGIDAVMHKQKLTYYNDAIEWLCDKYDIDPEELTKEKTYKPVEIKKYNSESVKLNSLLESEVDRTIDDLLNDGEIEKAIISNPPTADNSNSKTSFNTQLLNVDFYCEQLLNNKLALEYLNSRGISEQTIKDLKLGFNEYSYTEKDTGKKVEVKEITIPYLNSDGSAFYLKSKDITNYITSGGTNKAGGYKNKRVADFGLPYMPLWGYNTFNGGRNLYLVEGALDSVAMYEAGYRNILSSGSCNISKEQGIELLNTIRTFNEEQDKYNYHFDSITIILDNDAKCFREKKTQEQIAEAEIEIAKLKNELSKLKETLSELAEDDTDKKKETEEKLQEIEEKITVAKDKIVKAQNSLSNWYNSGLNGSKRLVEFLLENRVECFINVVVIPTKINDNYTKDLNDYIINFKNSDPNLKQLLKNNSKNGLEFLAEYSLFIQPEFGNPTLKYDGINYLIDLINKSKRWIDKRFISYLITTLEEWAKDETKDALTIRDFNYLKQIAKEKPTQKEIKDEVIAEHDLLFNKAQGMFEYRGLAWDLMFDEEILNYIDEARGHSQEARFSGHVLELIQHKKVTRQQFNKSELAVFSDGQTLELETGKVRPSNRNDFMSMLLPVNCDPKANCPNFKQAVYEWMGGDQQLIDLIQEIGGHILCSDNHKIEKAIYLVGEGSNGKSVFINTIRKVFGTENCTTVNPEDFGDGFSRSLLSNAMVNLVAEVDPYLGKNSKYIKTIASGDPLTGGKKYKDIEVFNPRCKLIVSVNELPKTSDKTHGFERKLIFVPFNQRFEYDSENVDGKFLLKDPTLPDKLEAELDGIIYWFYLGYLRLVKNNYEFTKAEQSEEMKKEFIRENDKVLDFYEAMYSKEKNGNYYSELKAGAEIYYKTLFDEFISWFNGDISGITQGGFSKKFAKLFINEYPEWDRKPLENGRGLKKIR